MAIRKIKAALVNTRDATDYSTEIGYLFYDADPNGDRTLRISDGSTPGGIPLLASGDSSTGIAQAQLKVADDSSSSTTFEMVAKAPPFPPPSKPPSRLSTMQLLLSSN